MRANLNEDKMSEETEPIEIDKYQDIDDDLLNTSTDTITTNNNRSIITRPYQIWSKLSDLSQTFPKVVSGVPSNTCEISGQLKKSLRRFTSNLWFGPTEGLILHYFWLYLENRSTYKVARPLKMCRMAIFSMVYQHSRPLVCTLLEI